MNDMRLADRKEQFVPRYEESVRAIGPPAADEGAWVGAPSALVVDGVTWLAYRPRRPGAARVRCSCTAETGGTCGPRAILWTTE